MALDFAITRLEHAALGRALNGVATPVFFQGQQVGERRHYDERLTLFLLRYRAPARYGAWLDAMTARESHPDGPAIRLTEAMRRIHADAAADAAGRPRPEHRPLRAMRLADDPAEQEATVAAAEAAREAEARAAQDRWGDALQGELDDAYPGGIEGDMA